MAAVENDNPFRLPPDDQIFLIREQERQKRAEERERVKTLRVWEKTTASQNVRKTRRVDDGADDDQNKTDAKKGARTESVGRDPRREKENVSDFVAKKREMFLVQMSLDVKKAEILKLDEKAKQKEEALKKSQLMLDEDVNRFDSFLQSNDQKAHKAMKDAEDMTKKKQDRMQRIKTLKTQLSAIQAEIAKHREQKDECFKYKTFLEKLTPQEWQEEQKQVKVDRQQDRRKTKIEDKLAELSKKIEVEIKEAERSIEEKGKTDKPKARAEEAKEARERQKEVEQAGRRIRKKYPGREQIEQQFEDVESSGEEMPLYFEEPKQLLEIFTALEESNLFLIQNSQDTEQALEELQQKFDEMKKTSDAKSAKMEQNIAHLNQQINDERGKCDELKQQLTLKGGASEHEGLLQEMADKVTEVHSVCIHSTDHDADTLKRLAEIEAKLEDHLVQLDLAEEEGYAQLVADLEKDKEKKRRETVRKQKKEQMDRKIEDRLKMSLARSQAPIHKKVGKQIMFRSAPLFQARKEVQEDDGYEDAVKEHDVFGIWMDKNHSPNDSAPTRPPQRN